MERKENKPEDNLEEDKKPNGKILEEEEEEKNKLDVPLPIYQKIREKIIETVNCWKYNHNYAGNKIKKEVLIEIESIRIMDDKEELKKVIKEAK